MILFSLLVGLLPHFLLWQPSDNITFRRNYFGFGTYFFIALFNMALAGTAWRIFFGEYFIIGALFILLANLPKELLGFAAQKVTYEK